MFDWSGKNADKSGKGQGILKFCVSGNPDMYIVVELAWRSGSVIDCHAMAWGKIPDGYGVKIELHVLRKGQ